MSSNGYCWICDETYFDDYHDEDKHKKYLNNIRKNKLTNNNEGDDE